MNLNKLLNKKKYPNILAKTFQVLVFISSGKHYIALQQYIFYTLSDKLNKTHLQQMPFIIKVTITQQKETRCWTCGIEDGGIEWKDRGDWCGQGVGVFNKTCPSNNMTCYKEIWILDKLTRMNKYIHLI